MMLFLIVYFVLFISTSNSIPISGINHNPSNITYFSIKNETNLLEKLELDKFANFPANVREIGLSSEDIVLTSDDRTTQDDWGGKCTVADWDKCKVLSSWLGHYLNPKEGPDEPKWLNHQLDCKIEPTLCMKNGWTVNRCHILCIGTLCNPEMLYKFDKYVSHEDECMAQPHG